MKIGFLKLCCPGDLLFTTPAVRAVRSRFPDASLYYITGGYSSFVADHNPHIDRTIIVAPPFEASGKMSAVLELIKGIKLIAGLRLDLLISFHRSRTLALLGFFGRADRILGFSNASPLVDISVPFDSSRHEVQRYLDLVSTVGCEANGMELEYATTEEEDERAAAMLKKIGIDGDFAVVAPGGGENPGTVMFIKRWPIRGFRQVTRHIKKALGLPVIAVGSASEKELADSVDADYSLAGRTSFPMLAAVLKRSSIVVANDSGPLYLASAVGARTVGIYGPSSDDLVGPRTERHRSVKAPVWCQPCYRPDNVKRGRIGCPSGTWACLLTLRAETVCEAIDNLAAGYKPSVGILENRK
jgi:ADP-heptose:LPS heptosyltransferase